MPTIIPLGLEPGPAKDNFSAHIFPVPESEGWFYSSVWTLKGIPPNHRHLRSLWKRGKPRKPNKSTLLRRQHI